MSHQPENCVCEVSRPESQLTIMSYDQRDSIMSVRDSDGSFQADASESPLFCSDFCVNLPVVKQRQLVKRSLEQD